jgi:hypothetical protein
VSFGQPESGCTAIRTVHGSLAASQLRTAKAYFRTLCTVHLPCTMACSKITTEFDCEFNRALKLDGSANEVLQGCLKVLKKHNLSYEISDTHPKFFLVHRVNRNWLMLSPYNCHRNAAKIHRGGADRKLLVNAICMELASGGKTREEHIADNIKLVARSQGLLAPVNGQERYITVGCGHTTAFCKLAGVGGRTPEKSIQDEHGNIDVAKLCRNSEFKHMIEKGWPWTVVDAEIDRLYPSFALIAQRALNVSNHVCSEVGELEAATTLADSAADPGFKSLPDWKKLAVENVKALGVPCAQYASTILDFVELYGGGPRAPYIRFMDSFAKQYGCMVSLGQIFWEAVTNCTFHTKLDMFPLLRVSLCLANLVSPKIEDGIAKTLTKSDIAKVAHKDKLPQCKEYESTLVHALELAELVTDSEVALTPLGQIFVRIGLLATDKGVLGPEQKKHTLQQIRALFLKSLTEAVGKSISFEGWSDAIAANADAREAEPKTKKEAAQPASLDDHSNPEWIAKRRGFAVGKQVSKRKADKETAGKLFAIFDISSDSTVKLTQIGSYDKTAMQLSISLEPTPRRVVAINYTGANLHELHGGAEAR